MPWSPVEPHIRWGDAEGLREFAGFVLGVAAAMGIPIRWGGHFKTIHDGPHWELTEN